MFVILFSKILWIKNLLLKIVIQQNRGNLNLFFINVGSIFTFHNLWFKVYIAYNIYFSILIFYFSKWKLKNTLKWLKSFLPKLMDDFNSIAKMRVWVNEEKIGLSCLPGVSMTFYKKFVINFLDLLFRLKTLRYTRWRYNIRIYSQWFLFNLLTLIDSAGNSHHVKFMLHVQCCVCFNFLITFWYKIVFSSIKRYLLE